MNEQMLKEQARKIRKDIVAMIGQAKSGHPGGSLSAAEIVTYLYFEEMKIDPANPKWEERDRFVLSKGMLRLYCMQLWPIKDIFLQRSYLRCVKSVPICRDIRI